MSVNSYFLSPELTLPLLFFHQRKTTCCLVLVYFYTEYSNLVFVQLIYSKNVHRLQHDCLE